MLTLGWTILWLPLLTSLVITFFLRKKPHLAGWVGTGVIGFCFLLSLIILFQYWPHLGHDYESSLNWMRPAGVPIEFGVLLNGLSIIMLLVVTGIGTLVFLFSQSYMHGDESYGRYYASLSLFAFSMLGIVLANNFIQIFIFWELVGLSSYLLIGFWFQKPEASTAGKKAFLTTRVGDVGMMLGILALFGFFAAQGHGTFNFLQIHHGLGAVTIPSGWMTFIALGLFLGVVGKSAQVPLHVWLPDAMEGPTPVSALIHAATMVAAGIFMLTRVMFVFEGSHSAMMVIAWTGGITSFLAACIALVQNDIKKVLAYSTLSQLGYMVLALGLASPEAGMFHLTTHAFFKALLFLGAGSFIHAMHTQDIWEMRGIIGSQSDGSLLSLLKKMPVTGWTFIVATLALMGIPPLSGFFSKEEILGVAAHQAPFLLFALGMTVVFLTAFYMGRLVTIVFFPTATKAEHKGHGIHEGDWRITAPLLILAVLSLIGGFLPIKELVSAGHGAAHHGGGHHPGWLAPLSLTLALGGFLSAFFIYRTRSQGIRQSIAALRVPGKILDHKFYFDELYDLQIKYVQEKIARLFDIVERYVIVEWSVNGLARFTRGTGNYLRRLQTGVVQFYAFVFCAGVTVLIYFLIICGKF